METALLSRMYINRQRVHIAPPHPCLLCSFMCLRREQGCKLQFLRNSSIQYENSFIAGNEDKKVICLH